MAGLESSLKQGHFSKNSTHLYSGEAICMSQLLLDVNSLFKWESTTMGVGVLLSLSFTRKS